ncbi:camp-binding domain-like protein [Rhizoclosmatium globosum]|uniref:Camp-binding domain-like protein n=1 Tax=Rhizoclosmatium globosum TaxID=329046 RepID=A0A1Y2BXW4_9FUNG|nr:camp-binding domain-like protein [Rhizoclosmatium globosum]|eukprot:ORY39612.1 camp-binding domain-like protein [Rhizoclosmatium globosum]
MPEEDEKKSIYSSRRRSSFLRNPMPNIFKADAEEMPQIDSQISCHDNGTSQDAVILPPLATHTSENEPPPLTNSETKAPEPQAVPEKKKELEKYKLVKWLLRDPVYQDFGGNHSKQSQPKSSTATKEEFHFGIHPLSRFNVLWEFALSFVYLFALFEIPVVASFSNTSIQSTPISEALTIVFGTATFLKFVTLTFSPFLQLNILRYLTSSFLLDLAGTIPFDTLLINHINFPDTLLLIRLLHVCNIVRIFNTNPIYVTISHLLQKTFKVGSSFMSIFMLGGVLITFLHLHGCFIFLFGKLTRFESASWIAVEEILHVTMTEQYIWAYFAAVANTFPITGYQPSDPFEQVFSIVAALVGAVLYAILVGTISSFSFGLDSSGRRYKEKIDEVHEYMTYRKLSEPIKVKVRQYYELKYKGKYFDEDAILNEMNESLKQEIAVHNCRDLIAKVPFLNREVGDGRDAHFLARIAKVLRPVYYIKGDLIFDQGWVGNEMYFIQQGCVAIIVNGNRVGELRDGAFFGEVALLGEMPRTATIMAAGNTILYSFGRADFSTILKDYEDMALRIKLVFEERMAKIQKEKDAKLRLEAEKNQQ